MFVFSWGNNDSSSIVSFSCLSYKTTESKCLNKPLLKQKIESQIRPLFTCSVTYIKVGCVFLWHFNCRNFCSMLYYILSVEVESTCKIGVISSFRNISGVLCCNLLFPEMYKNLRNLDVQSVMGKLAKKYCSLLSENVLIETHIHSILFNMDWSFLLFTQSPKQSCFPLQTLSDKYCSIRNDW